MPNPFIFSVENWNYYYGIWKLHFSLLSNLISNHEDTLKLVKKRQDFHTSKLLISYCAILVMIWFRNHFTETSFKIVKHNVINFHPKLYKVHLSLNQSTSYHLQGHYVLCLIVYVMVLYMQVLTVGLQYHKAVTCFSTVKLN